MRKSRSPVFVVLSIAFLSSCGKKAPDQPPQHGSEFAYLASDAETLENISKVEKSLEWAYGHCDQLDRYDRKKIFTDILMEERELKARIEAAEKLIPPKDEDGEHVSLSPYKNLVGGLQYLPSQEKSVGEDKWDTWRTSWAEIEKNFKEYQAIKASYGDEDLPRVFGYLQQLLGLTKRLAFEDYWRIYALWDYESNQQNMQHLKLMDDLLESEDPVSLEEVKSLVSAQSDAFQSYWLKAYSYQYFLESASTPRWGISESDAVKSFRSRVSSFLSSRYGASRSNVIAKKGEAFEIYIHAGEFSGVESKLESWFVDAWQKFDELKFNVNWVDASNLVGEPPLIFTALKLFYTYDFSSLSYVSRSSNEMHLAAGFSEFTFQHEMGHVLGLPDEYYTNWDQENCEYVTHKNDGNIMSSSRTGLSLESHKRKLLELYDLGVSQ